MPTIRLRVFLSVTAAAAIAIACQRAADSDPQATTLPGSYVYAAQGTTLGRPWEFTAQLQLRPDRTYSFTLNKTVEGKRDPTESTAGTYTVVGDRVLMSNPSGGKTVKDIRNLQIKADSLIPEVGWTAELVLKGVGVPNIVFVKRDRG
jgi:hypothetical protein